MQKGIEAALEFLKESQNINSAKAISSLLAKEKQSTFTSENYISEKHSMLREKAELLSGILNVLDKESSQKVKILLKILTIAMLIEEIKHINV